MIAKWIGNAKKVWMRGIQTRVDVTASMLGSMKVRLTLIKIVAFANTLRKGRENAWIYRPYQRYGPSPSCGRSPIVYLVS
jgi:hypothetical protein